MRVITGSARGRKLQAPEGFVTRPTSDRVKEAIFSIVQFELEGRRVLDLFAGSGQMGIEALSRGAVTATFVERNPEAVKIIKANLAHTRLEDRGMACAMDVTNYLKRCRNRFDVIFIDPPYRENLLETTVKQLSEIDILSEGGIIVCERPSDMTLNAAYGAFTKTKDYRYGKTGVTVYRAETQNV